MLDWPLPSTPEEFRTRHGELIAGVQLDELYQGTALVDARAVRRVVRRRPSLPEPVLIDLPSGASRAASSSARPDRDGRPRRRESVTRLTVIVPFICEWIAQWNG